MPANLNALIRYKTINSCLFGGKRKWTIQELKDACSEALAESRGRYEGISERTIRDDIRVMRSDILGFNAPIMQEKSLYFYSDPQFSILNLRITDAGLADKIYVFLMGLRDETKHPELENILEQLCNLTKRSYEEPAIVQESKKNLDENSVIRFRKKSIPKRDSADKPAKTNSEIFNDKIYASEKSTVYESVLGLSWEGIFNGINRDFNWGS